MAPLFLDVAMSIWQGTIRCPKPRRHCLTLPMTWRGSMVSIFSKSRLGLRRDYDPRHRTLFRTESITHPVAIHFLDHFLCFLKLGGLSLLALGNENQMVAKLRGHHVAHFSRLEGKGGLGEGLDHAAGAREPAQVAALVLGRAG